MKPSETPHHDHTLRRETILLILASLDENPVTPYPETRQYRRARQLRRELRRRERIGLR